MSMFLQVHDCVEDVDVAATKVSKKLLRENANASDSSSSSSLLDQEDSSDDDKESKSTKESGSFSSFASLEESLPLKRGLSNYFSGKSRSFGNLSACENATVEELAKPENPFNKRQRILTSLSRRASCSSIATAMPNLMSPQHAVKEEEGEEEDGDRDDRDRGRRLVPSIPVARRKAKNAASFRATCSFSDLQRV